MRKTDIADILVVGGNDAGLSAAGRAKRLKPDLNIRVFEKTPYAGYASCALPYMIAGKIPPTLLAGPSVQELEQKRGFRIDVSSTVTQLDTFSKTLHIHNSVTGKEFQVNYRKLLLATGAKPIVPQVFDVEANNVFTLRNYQHGLSIHEYIQKNNPQSAIIIGAGFTGLECAEALQQLGINTSLVDKEKRIFPDFSKEISLAIEKKVNESGIQLYLNSPVDQIILQNNKITHIVMANGQKLPADMLIIAASVKPSVELAVNAGIPLGNSGALIVNDYMQTRRMDVYAVGDCVETKHLVLRKPKWMPFAGIASKQGRIAGSNLAGQRQPYPGALGTSMLKVFGLEFGTTGLTLEEARNAGFNAVETIITHHDKPSYIHGSSPVIVILVTDRKTRQILGGQLSGQDNIGTRLNILAAAITGGLKPQDLEFLDLGYTPMVNNLWDPLAIAGNAAQKK